MIYKLYQEVNAHTVMHLSCSETIWMHHMHSDMPYLPHIFMYLLLT